MVVLKAKSAIVLDGCAEYHRLLCSVYLNQLTSIHESAPARVAHKAFVAAEDAVRCEPVRTPSSATLLLRARAQVAKHIHRDASDCENPLQRQRSSFSQVAQGDKYIRFVVLPQ